MRTFITGTLCALAACTVSAQEVVNNDTTVFSDIMLGEVTVKSNGKIEKIDRRALLPTAEQVRAATGGLDLLRRMHLPHVSINPLDGGISLMGGGSVSIRIDGVQATSHELAALSPEDIVRVELHDMPGARYANGGADLVIDCITRRRTSGGGVSADLMGIAGQETLSSLDNIAVHHANGKSAFTFDMNYMGMKRDNWMRDYEETWHTPGNDILRTETGMPVSIGISALESSMGYSIAEKGKYYFSAKLALDYAYEPGKEEGDRNTVLRTSDSDSARLVWEHTTQRSLSPSLNLYLQRTLGEGRQLVADVVGTLINTRNHHTYRESDAGNDDLLSEIYSDVRGRKQSVIAEAFYEKSADVSRLSFGARHMQAWTDNRYNGTTQADVTMRQSESSAFAEYGLRKGIWNVMGSLSAVRTAYSQEGNATQKLSLQPSVQLTAEPLNGLHLRYGASLRTQTPALSALSDVEQDIQEGMVRRGNPSLKAYSVMLQHFKARFSSGIFGVEASVKHRFEHHPVMESVKYENGMFVRTYENQRSFQQLTTETTLSLRPWRDHLNMSVTPLLMYFRSHGNTYLHSHTLFRLKVDTDLSLGNWIVSYNTMIGPANTMYDETLTEERPMNFLFAGYKCSHWSLQLGVWNLFMKEYWMKTQVFSALTPSTSHAHCDKNTYLALKFAFSINYGRQTPRHDKQINNEDRENGIMQGTK